MATAILLSNWSFVDFMNFYRANSGDEIERAFTLAQKVITAWDYDVDITKDDAINDLNPIQSASVLREVMQKIEEFTNAIDTGDVEVDFEKWTNRRFLDFNKAQANRDWNRVESLMKEIASIKGCDKSKPLSAIHGMMMQTAITEKYQRIVSGKN